MEKGASSRHEDVLGCDSIRPAASAAKIFYDDPAAKEGKPRRGMLENGSGIRTELLPLTRQIEMADWKKQRVELEILPHAVVAVVVAYSPITLWDLAVESEEVRRYLPQPWEDEGECKAGERQIVFTSDIIMVLLASPRKKGILTLLSYGLGQDWIADPIHLYSFCAFLTSIGIDPSEKMSCFYKPEHKMWSFLRFIVARQEAGGNVLTDTILLFIYLKDVCSVEDSVDKEEIKSLGIVSLLNEKIEKALSAKDYQSPERKLLLVRQCSRTFSEYQKLPLLSSENVRRIESLMSAAGQ